MDIVTRILSHLHEVSGPQMKFLLAMFAAMFAFQGKANRVNLHRYGAPPPRTQYRQQQRPFDATAFNLAALKDQGVLAAARLLVMDATFVKKSGKHTYGRGWFYNGCHSRAERGLEFSVIGLVDPDENTAYAVNAQQSPAEREEGKSGMVYALEHLQGIWPKLPEAVTHGLFDGAYAKHDFIHGVLEINRHAVSKLRRDAAMRYLYTGPKRPGSGRQKTYDGKVRYNDITRWDSLGEVEEGIELHTVIAWHDTLKLKLRVVMASKRVEGERKYVLLFSTDTALDGRTIYLWYKSRFQIEFVFRDGKQHLGLADGQMRNKAALDYHVNLSLAAVNILRLQERARGHKVISLASIKRRKYNELFMERVFSMLDLDPESPEIQPLLEPLRDFGRMAA